MTLSPTPLVAHGANVTPLRPVPGARRPAPVMPYLHRVQTLRAALIRTTDIRKRAALMSELDRTERMAAQHMVTLRTAA